MILGAIKKYEYWFKYERFTILWYLLIFPLLTVISFYFRGIFIKNIEYLGIRVPYIKFLLISWTATGMIYATYDSVVRGLERIGRTDLLKNSFLVSTISEFFIGLFWEMIRFFTIYFPVIVFFGFSLLESLVFLFFSIMLGILTFFFSLFIASLSLILRSGDFRPLEWFFWDFLLMFLIPVSYSIFQVIPKKYEFLLYFFPASLLFEGIRGLFIVNDTKILINNFFLSSILTIPWIFISLLTFKELFEISRRRGLIRLK